MSEPPRKSNRLAELLVLLGAPGEIEPVNRHVFARKLGQVVARATVRLQERYGWRRLRNGQPQATSRRKKERDAWIVFAFRLLKTFRKPRGLTCGVELFGGF